MTKKKTKATGAIIHGLPPDSDIIDELGSESKLTWADRHGTRRETKRYSALRKLALPKIKAAGYDLASRPFGSGRYSTVYALKDDKNQTLKLTGDATDAATWARLAELKAKGKISDADIPTLSRVSLVRRIPGKEGGDGDLFAICAPRYKPLDEAHEGLVDAVMEVLDQGWPARKGGDKYAHRVVRDFADHLLGQGWRKGKKQEEVRVAVDKALKKQGLEALSEEQVITTPRKARALLKLTAEVYEADVPEAWKLVEALLKTLVTMQKHNLYPRDLHTEQFMAEPIPGDGASWRIVDLGITSMLDNEQFVEDL